MANYSTNDFKQGLKVMLEGRLRLSYIGYQRLRHRYRQIQYLMQI